ncbi:MAG: alpha/beta hydrolase [Sphingomicrobium sp.]
MTPAASDPKAPIWPARERFALWPGTPPGAPSAPIAPVINMNGPKERRELWVRGVQTPEVNVYRPARPDGSAMLVFPGGGYYFLSVQNEGLDAAQRFNMDRMTVFVLSYRLPGEGWANRSLVPLSDAQRAMRLIRARAGEFGIDPARLGVMGFSAGGHLAAHLTASHDEPAYMPVDAADRQSARPAYSALIYPVATLDPKITHKGSFDNLLGKNPSEALIAARSPERHVTSATPPSFVVHAFDDGAVPIANSLRWIEAAQAAKVPVEAHLFTEGGHGFGFHLPKELPGSRWPDLFSVWLRKHGG